MSEKILIAIVGFVAAIFGSLLTHGLQWWRERADRMRLEETQRNRTGAQIAHMLDNFAVDCASIIKKNFIAELGATEKFEPQFEVPEIGGLPGELDPSALCIQHHSRLLSLKVHRKAMNFNILYYKQTGGEPVAFEDTKRHLGKLGQDALCLARDIRRTARLSQPSYDDPFFPVTKILARAVDGDT